VEAFGFVLEHPPGFRVNADLLRDAAVFDVERVAQPASAALLFGFFVDNLAGMGLQRDSAGLFDGDPRLAGLLSPGR
jgi:hypothetical protein